jgi:hypothetical protein
MFSLVSNHQTDVTSFDQLLKLILFGFIVLFWLGLESGFGLGIRLRVWISYIAI